MLYFSSNVAGGYSADAPGAIIGDDDIYVSEWHGGSFQAPQLVEGVNTAFNDSRPNLSHDGQELFFHSNRGGGAPDIYYAFARSQTSHGRTRRCSGRRSTASLPKRGPRSHGMERSSCLDRIGQAGKECRTFT